ncbi:MAG: hypothetical protein ACI4TW_06920 [Prevotella sp.]
MIRIFKYTMMCLSLGAGAFLTACSDMMDTDSELVEFVEDNNLNSPTDSVYSVMGIVHKMQVIADRTVILGELRGDLTAPTAYASNDLKALASFEVEEGNSYNNISDYYAVINNCNYFLSRIDTALVKNDKKVFEAEFAAVKTFRAWTYLQAALVYGDIPLVTVPLLTEKEAQDALNMPYSSIVDICNYFIDDIRPYVDTRLPQYGNINGQDSRKFFIPVRALLGDLCLWAGRYAEAAAFYHDYLTLYDDPHPTMTTSVEWPNNKEFNVAPSKTMSSAYSLTGMDCLSYIPMEKNEFQGVYSQLGNIFNSTIANYYYMQAGPSKALMTLSAAQDYCLVYKASSTISDTLYAPKTNLSTAFTAGDLRLYATYNISKYNQDYGSKYNSDYQKIAKITSSGIMTYRTNVIYLRFAEALNRAGYPQSAFAVLKYGLQYKTIDMYIDEEERTAAGSLLSFDRNIFTETNTMGIHSRGSGNSEANKRYVLPQPSVQLASRADTVAWQIPEVENLIIDEMALETAFEGMRYYDLMRVALRRNDASYLARPVSLRNGEADGELYNKLMNKDNWYLKK